MKRAWITLAGLALTTVALAQLSKYKDWPKSAEAYFLTPAERDEWSRVKSDDEAEKFIATYWAKRDPTPGTVQNEFRDGVLRRIAAADEQFKSRRQKGSETARGRLFVALGSPSRVTQSRGQESDTSAPGAPSIDPRAPGAEAIGGSSQSVVVQTWIYDKDKFNPSFGIGELRVRVTVDPQRGTDEIVNASAANQAIAKVAEKTVVNPTGVVASAPAVPAAGTGPGAPSTAPAPASPSTAPAAPPAARPASPASGGASAVPPPAAPAAAVPAAVRSTLEPLLKEAGSKKEEGSSGFWGGPFRTASGEPFYALQLYLPADKASAGPLKFGGVVTSESGQEAITYWEDASLFDMKTGARGDKVFEKSVVLPAGSYRGAFGLFAGEGAPVVSSSAAFKLEPKSGAFEVSPLILGNTLTPLTKRPGPTDAFVFGTEKPIRVEPKANRLFTKEDGLWYFYTVTNPTLPAAPAVAPAAPAAPSAGTPTPAAAAPAADAPKPRVMMRLGVLRDGQPAFAPFSGPAELQMLAPNYYGSGSEIPLATFEPGYYTITLNLRDLNAPKDSAAYKGVDRREDFVVLKPDEPDGTLPEKGGAKAAPKPKPPAKKS